jgi:hypothetical protein
MMILNMDVHVMTRSLTVLSILLFSLACIPGLTHAALITFDDVINSETSYSYDANSDGITDIVFSTTDIGGFRNLGPGPNMTYIHEPGLEGSSLLSTDLRVDFLFGAIDSLSFGFALDSTTEDDTTTFSVFDSNDNLLVTSTVPGLYTSTPLGTSSFPEGVMDVSFAGTAAYGLFDFTSDIGRYIIDDFGGTFGTSERIPEPKTLLLLGIGLLGLAHASRITSRS